MLVVVAVPISSTTADADPPVAVVAREAQEPDPVKTVRLRFGDRQRSVDTRAATVGELLAEQGIALLTGDRVEPAPGTPIGDYLVISVRLVREMLVYEETPVPHGAVSRYDDTLPLGHKVVLKSGESGLALRTYQLRTINGEEAERTLISEETVAPKDEVVLLGTNTALAPAGPPGEGECREQMAVWATYYTAASAGGTVTRTGTGVFKGIIATDPSVIPLGTRMYVPGYGYGIAADTGGGVIGAHIDLAYGAGDVKDWGSRNVEICILG